MLSTSKKTRFQYQYLLIAVLILALASVIALYQVGVLPSVSVGQPAAQSLTILSPAEASTYRWEAMAEFYAKQASAEALSWPPRPDFSQLNQQAMIPVTGGADAARYTAMAEFFAAKEAASIQRGRDADAARYTAMAKLYAAQSESIQYGPPGR